MRSVLLSVLLLGASMLFLRGQESIALLLVNGKIWTVNPQQREAEAVAISGNHIVAVGSIAEISRLKQPGTHVVDLEGKRVLPGFNDAHVHFYAGGSSLAGPQLRNAKSEEEFRAILTQFVQRTPKGR